MNQGTISAALDEELTRDMVELQLIEDYHWTPAYIETLDYKWIQRHNVMKRAKNASVEARHTQQQLLAQAKSGSPGKKGYREI
jgi:hypothetical protein